MLIKTNTQIIQGEHNGVPFSLEGGVLKVNSVSYSKAELRTLIEISNLLHLEGFELTDKLPANPRIRMFGNSSVFGFDPFGYGYGDGDER